MNIENKEYKLYVPTNVKTRLEFFNGFGVNELILSAIIAIILLPISFIVYKIKDSFLIPIIIEFVGIAGTIMITIKDSNNLCVVSQIKFMIDFGKMQKKFDYDYFNELRDGE